MKLMAVAASLLVILSLATAASAYERDVPDPEADPAGTAGAIVDQAGQASQRIIDEYAPDPTTESEDHQGSSADESGDDAGRAPSAVPGHQALFCGHIQIAAGDCPESDDDAADGDAPHHEAEADVYWFIAHALGDEEPDAAPDGQTLKEAPRGLVGALEALLEPVQNVGAAATRAMADTAQTAGVILGQATVLAEQQVAHVQNELNHLGDKFFEIVTGKAPGAEAPGGSGMTLQSESVGAPVSPVKATGLAMAAVGGIGLLAGAFWVVRRLIGLGSISLLSRIPSKDIMKNDTRAAIFDIVTNDPGVSLNEVVSRLGISRNAVAYHLAVFESEHTVVSVKDGKYRRYFVNGGKYVNGAKDVVSTIKNDVTRNVIRYIMDHPGSIQKDVCQAVGTSPSATNWHITRLEKVGLVEKQKVANTVRYTPGPSFEKYDLGEFGLATPVAA